MRGKRSKQYRKLMHQYGLTFGFREPYQVILDAEILQDASRFSMDLIRGLERTLHGQVKPMITQCSIRHLYNASPKNEALIEQAKTYERRRCNHHTLDEPLSTQECLLSVVDSKGNKTNKHRYVVASQDGRLRAQLRQIPGVPMLYINRSVMIMEPMGGATEDLREREEKAKFKAGLKSRVSATSLGKRSRDDAESEEEGVHPSRAANVAAATAHTPADGAAQKVKRRKGPKGANPLSVKKPKSRRESATEPSEQATKSKGSVPAATESESAATAETTEKKKRKRKPKPKAEITNAGSLGD